MLVYQSKVLGKARKEAPTDADAISHKLLSRAGYINQLSSGVFSMLPFGKRTQNKIESIIRSAMFNIEAEEVLLPAIQPASLWAESGRLENMDPPLFRLPDRHDKEMVLASTHEEAITDLARQFINSYKDLPLAAFQIQTKFRNEMRSTGGLLRVREFQMKDLYSFHRTTDDLNDYYMKVREAYFSIFKQCDLNIYAVQADSGSIGGSKSEEFSVEAATGEDKVAVCKECSFAANIETLTTEKDPCPKCQGVMEIKACIENAHVFQLGTKYSEAMGAIFKDEDGQSKPVIMGCYGIGVGRLMATIVEVHHDDKGIVWPSTVAPFDLHVVALQESVMDKAKEYASELSKYAEVLLDDRNLSPGQKFAESDLIGIPQRIVISEKTEAAGKIEIVDRKTGNSELQDFATFVKTIAGDN